jgi:hypothetical protein
VPRRAPRISIAPGEKAAAGIVRQRAGAIKAGSIAAEGHEQRRLEHHDGAEDHTQ